MPASDAVPAACRLPSHLACLDDLAVALALTREDRGGLRLGRGWMRRWTVRFVTAAGEVTWPVADLAGLAVPAARPVRRFGWGTRQRHRPGLQYLVSTGRHHGFESLAEQRLLLVLDFVGVDDVVSQPLELRFTTTDGWARHVPDFLAVDAGGVRLIDVRPAGRVREEDRMRFAASAEVATALGWRYAVVVRWRPNGIGAVDALSAQRRPVADPLGVLPQLLAAGEAGPVRFADLVSATTVPVVARAHALHLIWHHRLAVDLAVPLGENAPVWTVPRDPR